MLMAVAGHRTIASKLAATIGRRVSDALHHGQHLSLVLVVRSANEREPRFYRVVVQVHQIKVHESLDQTLEVAAHIGDKRFQLLLANVQLGHAFGDADEVADIDHVRAKLLDQRVVEFEFLQSFEHGENRSFELIFNTMRPLIETKETAALDDQRTLERFGISVPVSRRRERRDNAHNVRIVAEDVTESLHVPVHGRRGASAVRQVDRTNAGKSRKIGQTVGQSVERSVERNRECSAIGRINSVDS